MTDKQLTHTAGIISALIFWVWFFALGVIAAVHGYGEYFIFVLLPLFVTLVFAYVIKNSE